MTFRFTSEAFREGGSIPGRHTCDGADASPPLAWSGAPEGTVAFALVVDDPDAPGGTWIHWVAYDLPPSARGLAEGIAPAETLSGGGLQGRNSWGRFGYGGPCPPSGTHRYVFRLYAVDRRLDLPAGATVERLREAMRDRILAEAALMGRYRRGG